MDANCQEYGFVRRYQEDKTEITGINNESWHFRYVGVPHATYMNANNLCLEEYIAYLRANTSKEVPLSVACSTGTYQIYATKETNMAKPEQEYTISGSNFKISCFYYSRCAHTVRPLYFFIHYSLS